MRLFYVTPTEPTVSETFIVDEISRLRALGESVDAWPLHDGSDGRVRRWFGALRALVWLGSRYPTHVTTLIGWRRRFPGLPAWVALRAVELTREVAKTKPDQIHVHFVDQTLAAAALAAHVTGTPLSGTAHARDIFFTPTEWFRRYESLGIALVSVCRYNVPYLIDRGTRASSIVVIPCGTSSSRSRKRSDLSGRIRLLAVGRLVEKKGFAELLAAITSPGIADVVEELRLIGDGPEREPLEELAKAARKAGVKVTFLGVLDRKRQQIHLDWANLGALPCKVARDGDRDSMPVVLKEFMAAGLPTLATREVGIPELLDDTLAVLCDVANPTLIAEALTRYGALDGRARAALASRAALHVSEQFDLGATVGSLQRWFASGERPSRWS